MVEDQPSSVATNSKDEPTASAKETLSFEAQIYETSMWAAVRASRAREFGLEWLALGVALAGLHLLFVAVPRATLTFLDVFIVMLTAGGGVVMYFFENRRGSALRELSVRILKKGADDGKD